MTHLRPEELSALLDGALQGDAREQAERHVAECAACRESLAALTEQDARLRSVLTHDPGEAYFATFAARVEDRIRAAGLQGAQSRLEREGVWGWLNPRRLAWAGAVAAVIGGAGIVMLTRQDQRRMLENPEIVRRNQAVHESAPSLKQEAEVSDHANQDLKKLAAAPESKRDEGARATRQEEIAQAPATAIAPKPGPAEERMARNDVSDATAPARAKEVRRTASGEDVPVSGQAAPFAAPPATSGAQGGLTAAKPQAASPMSLQSSKSALAPSASKDGDGSTRLCGRVVDARQRPVAGATVALADRGLVTNTGADGRFCFDAAAGLHELSVMAVGYEATRLQVRIEGESSEAMVTLRSVSVLDQPTANGPSGRAFWGDLAKPGGPTDSFQEVATGLTARAESLQSVAAFQQAAEAWSKVVSESRDPARLEARYRLAETRFKTWQLDRTKARARAALQAIDAFLGAAPAGLRKDQASQWRREIHY